MLHVYVDGSCTFFYDYKTKKMVGDKSGGIGIVIIKDGEIINSISESYNDVTNQKMELLAIIRALQNTSGPVTIYSDSQYALNCSGNWINSEKGNYLIGWMDLWRTTGKLWSDEMKEDGSPILCNRYYIREIYSLMDKRKVKLVWIRGHTGIEGNEMADKLSNRRDDMIDCEYDIMEVEHIYNMNN